VVDEGSSRDLCLPGVSIEVVAVAEGVAPADRGERQFNPRGQGFNCAIRVPPAAPKC
jgi:hypothetical protein